MVELEEYKPQDDFVVNNLQSLVDFDVTDSTELWLIQIPKDPKDQYPDFNGEELKVTLDKDGELGRLEDSSGKEFELVSYASQDGDATVFIPSGEESKIVGKISRRVSLVRFPEPEELIEKTKKKTQQKLVEAVTACRARSEAKPRSSKPNSTVTSNKKIPMSLKRKHSENSDRSGKSMLTVSGGSTGKSKKKMKLEK